MVPFLDLWLPIVLSAVFVFLVSSVVHMALPIHKGDFERLPDEDEVLGTLRSHGVRPGQYMFPRADSMKEMSSPEMVEKMNRGPVGTMVVVPSGPMRIGKSLAQWFALSLVIGAFVAYAAGIGLPRGATGTDVFRLTSSVAFLGYGLGYASESIWKGVSWSVTVKYFFDGLLYSLATGAAFAWLWPGIGA